MEPEMSSLNTANMAAEPDVEKRDSDDQDPRSDDSDFTEERFTRLHHQKTHEDEESHPHLDAHQTQSWVAHPKNPFREFGFVAVLSMSQLMTQAGLAQVIVPLHIIGDSFGSQSPGQLSWFPAAYSLTVGTFILPAGRLGDLYGHKKLFVAGFLWWAVWSLIAGFAVYSGPILFDICRAFQGIGPALCLPNAVAILGRSYKPGVRKSMMFSAFGATAPTGFTIGAVFASILAEFSWWPWAFWINAIVCVLLAVLGMVLIPKTPPPHLDDSETTLNRIDALGGVLGVSGLVLFNFAWNQAPVVGWQNPYTYILLIVGILLLGLFGYVELHVSKFPLVPIRDMSPEAGFILACVALGWAGFGIWVYYTWQFIEVLRGVSPLLTSAMFSPTTVSGLCAAITTGFIIHRVPGSLVMGSALLAFTVGLILMVTAPVGQIYWAQTFVSMIVMPWGMDMSFPAANLLLSNKMAREHQGVSASLVNTVINYSISLSLGIAGTVEGQINGGGNDVLKGYRGAWYLGIGMAGAGVVTAMLFAVQDWRVSKRNRGS